MENTVAGLDLALYDLKKRLITSAINISDKDLDRAEIVLIEDATRKRYEITSSVMGCDSRMVGKKEIRRFSFYIREIK